VEKPVNEIDILSSNLSVRQTP